MKEESEHHGAYIPTRFANLPTLCLCSLPTCSDFLLYKVNAVIKGRDPGMESVADPNFIPARRLGGEEEMGEITSYKEKSKQVCRLH
jgi:hypothetical protein